MKMKDDMNSPTMYKEIQSITADYQQPLKIEPDTAASVLHICTHKSYQKCIRIGSLVCVPELLGKVLDIK